LPRRLASLPRGSIHLPARIFYRRAYVIQTPAAAVSMHGYPRGKYPDRVAPLWCVPELLNRPARARPRPLPVAGHARFALSRRRQPDRYCRWSWFQGRAIPHPGGSHTTCSSWPTRYAAYPKIKRKLSARAREWGWESTASTGRAGSARRGAMGTVSEPANEVFEAFRRA
jgi:hypothetical protein